MDSVWLDLFDVNPLDGKKECDEPLAGVQCAVPGEKGVTRQGNL